MPFPRGVADNEHIKAMDYAMAMACERLALPSEDKIGRERVAFLVTGFSRAGERDPHKLADLVVKQFKLPAP